ncbi:MAG TPA: OB-fold domain-containing protein [Mycobacteriales bacterium]|nr:OB-fold domain-containing protein [Mycobacteriales bacterium]
MTTTDTAARIPLVDYLALEPEPHLVAQECTKCGARYFDHRDACAGCFEADFRSVDVPTDGQVTAFTIVSYAPPGVEAPFVAAIVDCGGTPVRANLVDVEPNPEKVSLGMKVRLVTHSLGTDSAGTEAVGFGFAPA